MIILDTNVISELMRRRPDEPVKKWIALQRAPNVAVTSITIAAIQYGTARLPQGKKRSDLETRFEEFIYTAFRGRILSFDHGAAMLYGTIAAQCRKSGNNADAVDLMIAAIASNQNADVATRNVKDFKGCGVKIINPWDGSPAYTL